MIWDAKMKDCVKKWLTEQFGDDETIIADVFAEYVRATPEAISQADQAFAAADFPELDRIAHTLKGNALMIGDQESADAAILLRDAAKALDADGCRAAIVRIREVFAAAV